MPKKFENATVVSTGLGLPSTLIHAKMELFEKLTLFKPEEFKNVRFAF